MINYAIMAYRTPDDTISAYQLAEDVDASVVACEFFDLDDTQFYIVCLPHKVIIAFRGTSTVSDALDDIKFKLVPYGNDMKVHRGFLLQFKDSWKAIETFLDSHAYTDVCFVGHSLGGALACLAALETARQFALQPSVVTFGSPKIGNAKFALYFNSLVPNHTRYVNGNDAVTYSPWFFFHHCGNEVCIGTKQVDWRSRVLGRVSDHHLANYKKNLSPLQPE